MKRNLLFLLAIVVSLYTQAQLLTWTPTFSKDNDAISITVDGTKGNLGLLGFTSTVYIHTGVITNNSTNSSDWRYVKLGSTPNLFTTPVAALAAISLGNNKWRFDFPSDIRSFYGVPAGESILKIACLFRSGDGTRVQRNGNGGDMYIPIYTTALATRITVPAMQPNFIPIPEPISKAVGDPLPITGIANANSNMQVFLNGTSVGTASGVTTISATPTLSTVGTNKVVVQATAGAVVVRDSFSFFVAGPTVVAPLPVGVKEGINYNPNNTAATLVLYAPLKNRVSIIGDLPGSNWEETTNYQMNKTPDGNYWWKTITGLTSGFEYSFQYIVDGTIKIGDPYCEKVLDPFNDQFINAATYPNLKAYPSGQFGIVSTLQTAEPTYNWTANSWVRPNKKALVIYELLIRDFVAAHDFKTLTDSINYFKNLGVNAIQIMPFNEFEGNESWGYNPNYYFAPDKYYGPKNTVKAFIDACHANGIAVIMDMTMNHVFGSSPQALLYWDAANGQPAANNPWLNTVATHPFSVGYDFNHNSNATKYLVDRVVEHWLTEYKLDGFRWDLSKGFTQNVCGDVNCWNNYDGPRVATWKRIYDKMQATSANSYCILEHLGGDVEENELSNYGMMLWGKQTDEYNQVSMGFQSNSDFQRVIHAARGFAQQHLIGYAQSHDEERTMYKNITFGNQSGANGYNVRLLPTALKREEMIAALLFTIPGPKMYWQFAELGYDVTINACANTLIDPNCRTDNKPIRWNYFQVSERRRLYDIYASLSKLRLLKQSAFATGNIEWGTGGLFKWLRLNDPTLKLVVVANMDVNVHTGSVAFPTAGTYYDYLNGGTFASTGATQSFTLQPGEYRVYIDQNIVGTVFTPINNVADPIRTMQVNVYPNPVVGNATISYDLPESGIVAIHLLNAAGQNVGQIFKGFKPTGAHTVALNSSTFNTKKLAKGLYTLQFTVNNKRRLEKIIIQ